jgi:hypothetical protein
MLLWQRLQKLLLKAKESQESNRKRSACETLGMLFILALIQFLHKLFTLVVCAQSCPVWPHPCKLCTIFLQRALAYHYQS